MTNEELCYLAGFIDGEGCFAVNKREHIGYKGKRYITYSAYLDIGNTNLEVLQWIHNLIGITAKVYTNRMKGNRKLAYRIRICYRQAEPLTKKLLPFLIVKKNQAQLFLEYKNSELELKETIWQKMRVLNHRGIKEV